LRTVFGSEFQTAGAEHRKARKDNSEVAKQLGYDDDENIRPGTATVDARNAHSIDDV